MLVINGLLSTDIALDTLIVLAYLLSYLLSNIHRYWAVLVLGDTFCCSGTQYNTNQTAVSTVHMPVYDSFSCALVATIVCLVTVLIRSCCLLTLSLLVPSRRRVLKPSRRTNAFAAKGYTESSVTAAKSACNCLRFSSVLLLLTFQQ